MGLRDGYDLVLFKEDNQKILTWFQHLATLFAYWQAEHGKNWDPDKLVVTGSRGFDVSYNESDLDCTIVSDNFQDFLDFCIFLEDRFKKQHDFSAIKTHAGLPLLTVRSKDASGFKCPMLEAIYPASKLIKLEVTFRHPQVHQTIQKAGENFFASLSEEERLNYIINKRLLTLLKRAKARSDQLISDTVEALTKPIQIYADGELQSTPEFDHGVLSQTVQKAIVPEVHERLSPHIQYEAQVLATALQEGGDKNHSLFARLCHGERLAPDDWALGQELLEGPYLRFFQIHRDDISRQLKIAGKYYTSVPIITFSHAGKSYVLLMKNRGLQKSSDVQEVEWTAHGARVDSDEEYYPVNENRWALFNEITQCDKAQNFILAAACRRLSDLGIKISGKHIRKILLIDRAQAGLPEESSSYCTTYVHINLGERDPQEIIASCQNSTSRYAKWTGCFDLRQLIADVREVPHASKPREHYQLTSHGETLTVRMTTMRFILALSMLTKLEKDDELESLWQLRDPPPLASALTWLRNREDAHVEITLFSGSINELPAPQVLAYADKANLNPENLASTTLKPERLFLHNLLAQLIVSTKVDDKEQLAFAIKMLQNTFQQPHPGLAENYAEQLRKITRAFLLLVDDIYLDEIQVDEESVPQQIKRRLEALKNSIMSDFPEEILIKAYRRIHSLYKSLKSRQQSSQYKIIYNITESDLVIAVIIASYEQMYTDISSLIKNQVQTMVAQAIDSGMLQKIMAVPCDVQQFFGITGPVASGKSTSESLARQALQGQDAIFVSSDDLNEILIKIFMHKLSNYQMRLGKLTLAEAWFIKELIWKLIGEMNEQGLGLNVIQEAMSPLGLHLPTQGSITLYMNTASPIGAVERVKQRGDQSGRYVSGGETFASYRWPWFNLVAVIDRGLAAKHPQLCLHVMDTDLSYSYRDRPQKERIRRATIATLRHQTLEIYYLEGFIKFVNWSYMINPSPTSPADSFISKINESNIQIELQKLFNSAHEISVILNGQPVTLIELLEAVRKSLARKPFFGNHKDNNKMPDLRMFIDNLTPDNKTLLAYYGDWDNTPEERAKLSTTGIDEYFDIRNSLYLLSVFLKNDSAADIKVELSVNYSEDGFESTGIADSPFLETNITLLCTIRDAMRKKHGKEKADELLLQSFIVHDLGKMTQFINDYSLANNEPLSTAKHEDYLHRWLVSYAPLTLRSALKDLANWVDVFDGLGHNPQKLQDRGYVNSAAIVDEHILKLRELQQHLPDDVSGNHFEIMNAYLYQKALSLPIPLNELAFLTDEETKRTPWLELSWEQQTKIAMIIWSCPFIFVKPPHTTKKVSEEFVTLWDLAQFEEIRNRLTLFTLRNMQAPLGEFLFLYNITGLFHHNAGQGGSHFANGGKTADLFTTFFPFVLETIKKVKPEDTPITRVACNKFQALQGVEVPLEIFSLLDNNQQLSCIQVDFATDEVKKTYLKRLEQHLSSQQQASNSHRLMAAVPRELSSACAEQKDARM